jgi:hypothetical protein
MNGGLAVLEWADSVSRPNVADRNGVPWHIRRQHLMPRRGMAVGCGTARMNGGNEVLGNGGERHPDGAWAGNSSAIPSGAQSLVRVGWRAPARRVRGRSLVIAYTLTFVSPASQPTNA